MINAISLAANMGKAFSEGLQTVYDTAMQYADAFIASAQLICGIAAMIYVGSKIWRSWAAGESIDFYSLLRPFAIGLVVVFFSAFTSCLDAIIQPVTTATTYISSTQVPVSANTRQQYMELQEQLRQQQARYLHSKLEGSTEKLSVWRTISRDITNLKTGVNGLYEELGPLLMAQFVDRMSLLSDMAATAVSYFFKAFSLLGRLVLILIGPFTLALAILPAFQHNVRKWIAHYFHVCLYVPLCQLIGFLQSLLLTHCLYRPGIEQLQTVVSTPYTAQLDAEVSALLQMTQSISIILSVVAILLYCQVPRLAKWIVTADETDGFIVFNKK